MARRRLRRHPETKSPFARVIILALSLMIAAAATVFVLAFYTDACSVKSVVVKGNNTLGVDQVRRESGVDSYENLLTLPVGKIAGNLRQNSWIEEVKVSRKLLHTVVIEVRERQPIAVIDFGGAGFLVDDHAYVIEKVDVSEYGSLVRIHGGIASVPMVGRGLGGGKIRACIAAMGKMPAELRGLITLADPFDRRGQVFDCRLGFQIIYGPVSHVEKKNELIEAIMQDIQSNHRRVAYLDLRVPDSPVIKTD